MLTVKKLHDDLDYWIHIGIGDDIVNLPEHRPEYQHLVKQGPPEGIRKDDIYYGQIVAELVLEKLKAELSKPWFLQPTFWHLLPINLKSIFKNKIITRKL